jgi:hypothetical protein
MRIAIFVLVGLVLGAVVGCALAFGLLPFWVTITNWLDTLPGSCAGNEFCGENEFFNLLEISTMVGAFVGAAALGVFAARSRRVPPV